MCFLCRSISIPLADTETLLYPIASELPVTTAVGVVSDAAIGLVQVEDDFANASSIENLQGTLVISSSHYEQIAFYSQSRMA